MIKLFFIVLIGYLLLGFLIGLDASRTLPGSDRAIVILVAVFLGLPLLGSVLLEARRP
jgi:hypothetical protein